MPAETKSVFSKDTLVPASVVVALATALIGGGSWLSTQNERLLSIEFTLRDIQAVIARLEGRFEGYVTATDLRLWAAKIREENPTIKIPEFRKE